MLPHHGLIPILTRPGSPIMEKGCPFCYQYFYLADIKIHLSQCKFNPANVPNTCVSPIRVSEMSEKLANSLTDSDDISDSDWRIEDSTLTRFTSNTPPIEINFCAYEDYFDTDNTPSPPINRFSAISNFALYQPTQSLEDISNESPIAVDLIPSTGSEHELPIDISSPMLLSPLLESNQSVGSPDFLDKNSGRSMSCIFDSSGSEPIYSHRSISNIFSDVSDPTIISPESIPVVPLQSYLPPKVDPDSEVSPKVTKPMHLTPISRDDSYGSISSNHEGYYGKIYKRGDRPALRKARSSRYRGRRSRSSGRSSRSISRYTRSYRKYSRSDRYSGSSSSYGSSSSSYDDSSKSYSSSSRSSSSSYSRSYSKSRSRSPLSRDNSRRYYRYTRSRSKSRHTTPLYSDDGRGPIKNTSSLKIKDYIAKRSDLRSKSKIFPLRTGRQPTKEIASKSQMKNITRSNLLNTVIIKPPVIIGCSYSSYDRFSSKIDTTVTTPSLFDFSCFQKSPVFIRNKNGVVCNLCGVALAHFNQGQHLLVHLNVICAICGRKMPYSELTLHLNVFHSSPTPFIMECPICHDTNRNTVSTLTKLIRHILTNHYRLTCPACECVLGLFNFANHVKRCLHRFNTSHQPSLQLKTP